MRASVLEMAMTGITRIQDQLTQVEKKLVSCRLKAEERRAAEEQRLVQVLAKHRELDEAHQRRLASTREEYAIGIDGVVKKAQEEICEAERLEIEGRERARVAVAKADALDREARDLERQLFEVNRSLDMQEVQASNRYGEIRSNADLVVHQHFVDCHLAVKDAALYTAEVQDATLKSITDMQGELRKHVVQAGRQSEQRSRLKELQEGLSLMRANATRDLSHEEFVKAKGEILQAWLDDWVSTTHVRTPSTTLPSPTPGPLKPLYPDRPRSVDRARRRADDRMRSPPALGNGWDRGDFRPQTAP